MLPEVSQRDFEQSGQIGKKFGIYVGFPHSYVAFTFVYFVNFDFGHTQVPAVSGRNLNFEIKKRLVSFLFLISFIYIVPGLFCVLTFVIPTFYSFVFSENVYIGDINIINKRFKELCISN